MLEDDDPMVGLFARLPKSMLSRLRQAAHQQRRSLNKEVLLRLAADLSPLVDPADDLERPWNNIAHLNPRGVEVDAEALEILNERPELAEAIVRLSVATEPKAIGLTKRQATLLEFLRVYASQHNGAAPTFEEMMKAMNVASKSTISRWVIGLEERGYLSRTPRQWESIKLI